MCNGPERSSPTTDFYLRPALTSIEFTASVLEKGAVDITDEIEQGLEGDGKCLVLVPPHDLLIKY